MAGSLTGNERRSCGPCKVDRLNITIEHSYWDVLKGDVLNNLASPSRRGGNIALRSIDGNLCILEVESKRVTDPTFCEMELPWVRSSPVVQLTAVMPVIS